MKSEPSQIHPQNISLSTRKKIIVKQLVVIDLSLRLYTKFTACILLCYLKQFLLNIYIECLKSKAFPVWGVVRGTSWSK